MLPKTNRISRTAFPKGRPFVRRVFSWGTASLYPGEPQVAAVVSKKTLKKAHERNRARRRVYAALAKSLPNATLVIQLKREALFTPLTTVTADIEGLSLP